jgi:hypothetical protein
MRKLLFLPLFLLLAACGAATAPVETPAPESSSGDGAATTQESEQVTSPGSETSTAGRASVATGSTPEEASIVREQDYVIGAADPTVTIIEYGDFQ